MKWRKALPLVIEQSLELYPGLIHGRPRRVKCKTVANHELEVVKKLVSIGVFVNVKFASHRRQIHGLFHDLGVRRNLKLNPVCGCCISAMIQDRYGLLPTDGLVKGMCDCVVLLTMEFLKDFPAKFELFVGAVVFRALDFTLLFGSVGIRKILRGRRMNLSFGSGSAFFVASYDRNGSRRTTGGTRLLRWSNNWRGRRGRSGLFLRRRGLVLEEKVGDGY